MRHIDCNNPKYMWGQKNFAQQHVLCSIPYFAPKPKRLFKTRILFLKMIYFLNWHIWPIPFIFLLCTWKVAYFGQRSNKQSQCLTYTFVNISASKLYCGFHRNKSSLYPTKRDFQILWESKIVFFILFSDTCKRLWMWKTTMNMHSFQKYRLRYYCRYRLRLRNCHYSVCPDFSSSPKSHFFTLQVYIAMPWFAWYSQILQF